MRIRLVAVGQIKDKWLSEGIEEYRKRISAYAKIEITEIPHLAEKKSAPETLKKEAALILSALKGGGHVVALDLEGELTDSPGLAKKLKQWMDLGGAKVTFVIGGSRGLSEEVKERADALLSFSGLTFPHKLFRLMVLEQIYRAFTINNNQKYHK